MVYIACCIMSVYCLCYHHVIVLSNIVTFTVHYCSFSRYVYLHQMYIFISNYINEWQALLYNNDNNNFYSKIRIIFLRKKQKKEKKTKCT